MTHRFASIASSDKLAYVYASDHHYDGRAPISSHFRFYETCGDGLTAHSPSAPISVGMLADYLFSLAQAMASDNELIDAAGYEVRSGIAPNRDIRFAQSVVFKDNGKRRWVSREERKVTASETKRHDRRYEEVTLRHDGSWGRGSLRPVRLVSPGVPIDDADGTAVALVRSLSSNDFGKRAVRVTRTGTLVPPR